MLDRIKSGWTITRIIFLVFGLMIIVNSVVDGKWFGVIPGAYFASMGLFAFGCASGNCYGGSCAVPESKKLKEELKDGNK